MCACSSLQISRCLDGIIDESRPSPAVGSVVCRVVWGESWYGEKEEKYLTSIARLGESKTRGIAVLPAGAGGEDAHPSETFELNQSTSSSQQL